MKQTTPYTLLASLGFGASSELICGCLLLGEEKAGLSLSSLFFSPTRHPKSIFSVISWRDQTQPVASTVSRDGWAVKRRGVASE